MIEVDFTAHQAMRPVRAHGKALTEHLHAAGVIGAANEDHDPAQWRIKVELKALGHRTPPWCCFCNRRSASAARGNVCLAAVNAIKAAGGRASLLLLPDTGIKGNSHMMMMDKNNLQLAAVLLKWIDENVGK